MHSLLQASLETFFGLGLIAGPTVGGALYSLGGYYLPFVVLGTCLLLAAILTIIILPQHNQDLSETGTSECAICDCLAGMALKMLALFCPQIRCGKLLAYPE